MTKRATMIATAAITAVAVLIATGAVTNFFSPQEIGIAKERLSGVKTRRQGSSGGDPSWGSRPRCSGWATSAVLN